MNSTDIAATLRSRRSLLRILTAATLVGVTAAALLFFRRGEGPVRSVRLEATVIDKLLGRQAWTKLPFKLSAGEEADLKRCLAMLVMYRSTQNGRSPFLDQSVHEELEAMVNGHPGFFYAEYLLALWHERAGHPDEAARYHSAAKEHAPVVLVQPYVLADGSPARGIKVGEISIEHNRVQNGSLDPSLNLAYLNLTTDQNGHVRLPVYDTVFRRSSISHPEGYEPEIPRLGWFDSSRRTGVMPVVTLRPSRNEVQGPGD